jgi:hypothetical protein
MTVATTSRPPKRSTSGKYDLRGFNAFAAGGALSFKAAAAGAGTLGGAGSLGAAGMAGFGAAAGLGTFGNLGAAAGGGGGILGTAGGDGGVADLPGTEISGSLIARRSAALAPPEGAVPEGAEG